jgi:hypothetical protein
MVVGNRHIVDAAPDRIPAPHANCFDGALRLYVWVTCGREWGLAAAEVQADQGDEGCDALNPKAMRVSRRILVLTDAIRPLLIEQIRVCDVGSEVDPDAAGEVDERGELAACGPGQPLVKQFDALFPAGGEDATELFLEQVGAVERAVGCGESASLAR